MDNDKTVIYEFLEHFEDFTQSDVESGYKNVYRPSWHENPFQFWFNPPFDETGKSNPTLSGAIILLDDGTVMVENIRDHLFYNLDECVGDSVKSLVLSILNQ
jgi:hypothetical protein